jgi:hypothetical protein
VGKLAKILDEELEGVQRKRVRERLTQLLPDSKSENLKS